MSLKNQIGQNQILGKAMGHSVGLKLLLVCGLVLLMAIPALFIAAISFERAGRADDVTREVSERYGGPQTLLGPVLSLPYGTKNHAGEITSYSEYVIFAEDGTASVSDLQTTIRKRSLFKVPTYQAGVNFSAAFKLPERTDIQSGRRVFFWDEAKISIGLSDVRGLRDDVYLVLPDGTKRKFGPGQSGSLAAIRAASLEAETVSLSSFKGYREYVNLQFMDVRIGDLLGENAQLDVSASLTISGSQQVSISPFAQTTKANISADWPHPGFIGRYPPHERTISADGFSASWSVPFLARGMAAHGDARDLNLGQLSQKAMSVKLVNPVNPYQNVNRSLKYSVLFIGMVFLAYFLFETLVGVKVHAAQYVLIGLAQCVFYLLLLAFAEQIGFSFAFLIAAGATVMLTSFYAGVVFGKDYRLKAGAVFVATYGLLYVLMRMQDFALMVGALASFLAIAATMYLTRNVNWYGQTNAPIIDDK